MAIKQQYPIKDPNTRLLADTGAYGTFICDSANPFDAAAWSLANFGPNELYVGYVVKFLNDEVPNAPVVAAAVYNGVSGRSLVNAWDAGTGIVAEILELSMTSGVAEIILKKARPIPIT